MDRTEMTTLTSPEWTRRDRFIATCAFALGLASLCVPTWFNYIFTYKGDNAGLKGLIEAVVLIVEEPYLISALLAVFLNATLPAEFEEETKEAGHHEWNTPVPLVGSGGSERAEKNV
jgi:NCS2 family nucleobase:cation symporter-2